MQVIKNREHFFQILAENPGLVIIKFGASWCGPCKLIEAAVDKYFKQMPNNVQCMSIDIDDSFDIYAFLKSKKMINGIPAILCYNKGNDSYVPDEFVSGANLQQIADFFDACLKNASVV